MHPSWQNKLAEIIVLLMKQIGIKILITSHSPNFILALQTYSIKYKVEQECNFYTTQKKEDNYIIDYKIENNLNDLADLKPNQNSPRQRLTESLKKYDVKDSTEQPMFFDCIEVWNNYEFSLKI